MSWAPSCPGEREAVFVLDVVDGLIREYRRTGSVIYLRRARRYLTAAIAAAEKTAKKARP